MRKTLSLTKSRLGLTVSNAFMKSSATMEVRRQLSKLRSTTSEMKQFRRRVVRSTKTRLTRGKDMKIWDKGIKLWEANTLKQLWKERGERDRVKRWRRRGVISFRNRKNNWVSRRRERYCEKGRNLTYREGKQDIEEGTIGVCNRRDQEAQRKLGKCA